MWRPSPAFSAASTFAAEESAETALRRARATFRRCPPHGSYIPYHFTRMNYTVSDDPVRVATRLRMHVEFRIELDRIVAAHPDTHAAEEADDLLFEHEVPEIPVTAAREHLERAERLLKTTGRPAELYEAWLLLDLSGEAQVDLAFWWKEFGDETHSQDGVYFSDNDGASFVKSDPAAARSGAKLSWDLGKMAAGDSRTIQIWVKAERQGELSTCTTVTALPECCVATFVGKAEVAISKSGPESALLGESVLYDVVVTNPGTAVARDVVITDTLPPGMTFVSADSASACRANETNQITCTLDQLDGRDVATFTIVVAVDAAATSAFAHSATVLAEQFDPDESNNEITESTQVNSEADLSITHGP